MHLLEKLPSTIGVPDVRELPIKQIDHGSVANPALVNRKACRGYPVMLDVHVRNNPLRFSSTEVDFHLNFDDRVT